MARREHEAQQVVADVVVERGFEIGRASSSASPTSRTIRASPAISRGDSIR
jgi:hypothetical protein